MLPLRLAAALALALYAAPAEAACGEHPFAHAGSSLRALVTPPRLLAVAGASIAPLVLGPSGADHHVRVFVQRDLGGRYDLEELTLVAPYALVAASATGLAASMLARDCTGTRVSSAVMQSMLVAAALSASLKLALGRGHPTGGGDPYASNRLQDEGRPNRWHGPPDFGAWPSGHSAVTFAFASALRTTLPRAGIWRYAGYVLAGGVGLGMIWGDHHWASDVVSGALLGEAVGGAIGTGFRPRTEPRTSWQLVPSVGGGAIVGTF